MRIALALFSLGLFAVASSQAAAVTRVEALSRGINLSHWFAQASNGYSDAHLTTFITPRDLVRIRRTGFTHVRIGVAPEVVRDPARRSRFVEAVQLSLKSGLAVVADFHPVGDEKTEFTAADGAEKLERMWTELATALAPLDSDRLYLEVMNEPYPLQGEAWLAMQRRAVAAIRRIAAHHTIIVNPGGWSGPEDLSRMTPLPDENVVYTVHWYAPLLFTHQGADWTWAVAKNIGGVPWPAARSAADQIAGRSTRGEDAYRALHNEIAAGNFEKAFLQSEIERIVDWRRRHHDVPVYVGEFGVYWKSAPPSSAHEWITTSRIAFQRAGLGWAYWDSSSSFGLMLSTTEGRSFRPKTLMALDLIPGER
ncbi:MAG: glycoside hydrolase family 5 protein [Hyphomicrobium sp.]|nr:glycoside hydrolase family 5 protein [Hyphomicrobium sp.]